MWYHKLPQFPWFMAIKVSFSRILHMHQKAAAALFHVFSISSPKLTEAASLGALPVLGQREKGNREPQAGF